VDGWLKLWRQTVENPTVFRDAEYFAVWMYLLIQAKYEETPSRFNGKTIMLKKGQLTIGRTQIASALHISESKTQRILKVFEIEQQIEQQTCSKNRLITIVNWEKYQCTEQQDELQMNNKRTTNEQQMNTPKEYKKERNKEEDIMSTVQESNFNKFWAVYPRKESKAKAVIVWQRINPNDMLFTEIMKGLERYLKCRKVADGFIQLATTWLNGKEWESVYEEPAKSTRQKTKHEIEAEEMGIHLI
jgi:hypothetical protein